MKPVFAIVDAACQVLNIEVPAFGRRVSMPAVFCTEDDALHVASQAEGITGEVHAILSVANTYTLASEARTTDHGDAA